MPEDDYNLQHIRVISPSNEAIRKRPGMYFGSTDDRAIDLFIYELVANALDCYLAGTATFVSVEIEDDRIIVTDDGNGLPFDRPSEIEGTTLATKFLVDFHATASADGHTPHIHVGSSHGLGLAVLNAGSSCFEVRSWRDGMLWEQKFSQGVAISQPKIIDRGTDKGTRIEAIPDPEIFKNAKPRLNAIRFNLFELAHLVKGVEIRWQRERFYSDRGLVQLLPFVSIDLFDPFDRDRDKYQTFQATIQHDRLKIDAVAAGGLLPDIAAINTKIYAWVNGQRMIYGGSHVVGFLKALDDVNWHPEILMIHATMFDPKLTGSLNTRLVAPDLVEVVREALREPLDLYCTSLGNADPRSRS